MKSFGILCMVALASARVARVQKQEPLLQRQRGGPAVGVHFTTSYATAAARFEDGTVEELVRIPADASYIELMARWSEQRDSIIERRPADDAATLSTLMRNVKAAVEQKVGSTISEILPVFAPLAVPDQEAINDAFRQVGLTQLHADGQEHLLHDTSAAYAGLGYGLCESWSNAVECKQQEKAMRSEHVLFLNFDNSSFSATLQNMQTAYQQRISASWIDPSLGWWNMPVYDNPRAQFLTQIREIILKVAGAVSRPPQRIVLLGEHGGDEEFVAVARDALYDAFEEFDAEMMMDANEREGMDMLPARGAAELAWRARPGGKEREERLELR